MAIKELFNNQRPVALVNPKGSQRIDPRFKFTRGTTATYTDAEGIIRTADPNKPRFTYDGATGELKGFLVEASATNITPNSQSYTGFGTNQVTNPLPVNNTQLAPDGTTTAWEYPTAPTAFLQSNKTVVPGFRYTYSFFAKQGNGNAIYAFVGSGISQFIGVVYNWTTDTLSAVWKKEDYPNGWSRFSYTSAVTTNTLGVVRLDPAGVNPGCDGVYFWGLQIEQGTYASSYIPTTSTAVTRDADLLSIDSVVIPASGSIYVDAQALDTSVGSTLISLKNPSNEKINLAIEERTELYNSPALVYSIDGTIKPTLPFPVPILTRERNIITWGANNYQYTSSSARFAQSLSSSVPSNLTQLSIGHDSVDPTKGFNGYINAVYLYSGEILPDVAEALVRGELDPVNADTFVPTGPAGSLSLIINTQGAVADGNTTFVLPAESVSNDNDIVITWGDNTESGLEGAAAELGAPGLTKTYNSAGIYSVFVEGQLENLKFNNISDAPDLVQIVRWGTSAGGNDVFRSPSTMNSAFYGCSQLDFSLTARTTSLPDTSAVEDWTNAFRNCSSITGVFPAFNFSSATNFTSAFEGCSSLVSFTAAGDQTQNVTSFGGAWNNCTSLTTFPLINTSSGQSFGSTWRNCISLQAFPAINTSSGTNFNASWQFCSGLRTFPTLATSSATTVRFAWFGCTSLDNIANAGASTSFPVIDTSSVTNFGFAWNQCSSFTVFPLLTTSAGTIFDETWAGCSGLTAFPSIDTSNGTTFRGTWRSMVSLTVFPTLNTGSGTDFYRTWEQCSTLTAFPALDLSSAVGLATDTTSGGFERTWNICTNLANFPANMFDSTTCTRFQDAFSGCALTPQSIENILVSIEASGTSNGSLGIDGGSNASRTTWSVTAENAYNALTGRGWTITFNP